MWALRFRCALPKRVVMVDETLTKVPTGGLGEGGQAADNAYDKALFAKQAAEKWEAYMSTCATKQEAKKRAAAHNLA